MDPVRFGRALGAGARAAAKTMVQAADAATTPNPSASRSTTAGVQAAAPARPQPQVISPRPAAAPPKLQASAAQAANVGKGVKRGATRFGREVWNPFVRLSGVLWLEFTGVFFGIFALFAGIGAWRLREAWRQTPTNAADHQRLLGAVLMLAVFGYFCISSFIRAYHRERRR